MFLFAVQYYRETGRKTKMFVTGAPSYELFILVSNLEAPRSCSPAATVPSWHGSRQVVCPVPETPTCEGHFLHLPLYNTN